MDSGEARRERKGRAIEILRHRLPGVGRAAHEQPAWLVWSVLFVCILFPLLVVLAD